MTIRGKMQILLTITVIIMMRGKSTKWAVAEPEMELINSGCSQYNVTNFSEFNSNLNATFKELREQLNGGKKFATAQRTRGPDQVYTMVQCRRYVSTADCAACFTSAESLIRNCSAANGARVIYLACSLRYESSSFYDQSTQEGRFGFCGNRTALQADAFKTAAQELLENLEVATPKINGFFAASKNNIIGSRAGANDDDDKNSTAVYGIAQCVETISETGCQNCLSGAFDNIQRCLGSAFGWAVDAGCFLRYSDTPFFADNQTTDITPFLKNGSSNKEAIIGGVVGGGTGLILFALLIWLVISRKSKKIQRGNISEATELQGPVNYRLKDLVSATRKFSEENKLGEGGFGDIYKGTLKNGKIVAVKKLAIGISRRTLSDFENEVRLISNVHHRNLIRLLGCCSQGPELILVYEYMANSSLDKFLFARGLAYLHEDFHVRIIHRDIKPSNVLLDDDLQPKIADFGLARLLPENQSHLSTKFAGTLGYTAPEYAIHGQLSEKVDAYSFGVLVLEIISGTKSSETKGEEGEFLLKRAWRLYENGTHWELMDESLDPNECTKEAAEKVVEIALMCTQSAANSRPTMSEVVALLKSTSSSLLGNKPLLKPTFVETDYRKTPADTSTSTGSSTSNATASISQVSGR
ncbi:hypothetical protein KPL71_018840 [Citrus sinensis]|uniref:Uncharacterized protein n=1 Tax=Citrus sinensis TaxID=2711 RepID=A0ACB8K0D6_CITSI|nr:hypothetical protein KPL71_018840 [Citrus sinensis]